MTAIERMAYPRFKRSFTAKELEEVNTPTPEERFLAHSSTKGNVAEAGFLVLLKTHQRLGRFIPLNEVSFSILDHIINIVDPTLHVADLATYDTSGTIQRHILDRRLAGSDQAAAPPLAASMHSAGTSAGYARADRQTPLYAHVTHFLCEREEHSETPTFARLLSSFFLFFPCRGVLVSWARVVPRVSASLSMV